MNKATLHTFVYLLLILLTASCVQEEVSAEFPVAQEADSLAVKPDSDPPAFYHRVEQDISVNDFFPWVWDLVSHYDSLVPYELSEQLLVHANPWLIDSFAYSDYYHLMAQDIFVYDQRQHIILHKGDSLEIPSPLTAVLLENKLAQIRIDVNLPEYSLRLMQGDSLLDSFPIRIGQNRRKFLPSEGRTIDLRTVIGKGFIYQFNYEPKYINFNTGSAYTQTRRDDNKLTLMPLIPTIETEINGICYGQLIHPTTNPNSLGKAYSHGCMGTREGDAWRIYFHSRKGTPIDIRYDLKIMDDQGDSITLEDVYGLNPLSSSTRR